jgi:hypothetical protein
LGKAGGLDDGVHYGGVLDADLQQACYKALAVPRHEARLRSLDFSWAHATQLFEGFLVDVRPNNRPTSNPQSFSVSATSGTSAALSATLAKNPVIPLSSNK